MNCDNCKIAENTVSSIWEVRSPSSHMPLIGSFARFLVLAKVLTKEDVLKQYNWEVLVQQDRL